MDSNNLLNVVKGICMDYLYENLGDERFQEFCNRLVSKEFSNVQAFPVGQPDGGRDSLVYMMTTPKKEFIVFQVKFVRNPNHIKEIHKWLTEIIKGEVEKIDKLIPKGASGYYLMTNVRGTGHSDVGSIDKVNKILEDNIIIPSICWWREDLNMLFEKDPVFKWSYPEVLNGQDILNSVLFFNLNENNERRENVIKAYLADQYEMDNEVKFRQIDLQNGIFDLFTDVPVQIKKMDEKNKVLKRTLGTIGHYLKPQIEDFYIYEESSNMGAAAFLLHPKVQSEIGKILLEGGPGQGKSTISQYVSQVHRARLLGKTSDLELLPEKLKCAPVRLPFKMDMRHIADWVENKNPYLFSDEYFKKIWQKSLESFLVGHIYFHSKIENFNISDLIAICKLSPILFVFDGFDEIANLKVREEVIEFINKGVNRISENSKSLQILITSRPAAFSDSIGFSVDTYPHFELTDITPAITEEYVEKWIKASRLDSREASEIRRLVKEKLELPHLKDLAKSPMQLAIFISLLRTRGDSLPNKRTALYDSYIEKFFNRESEKDQIIRDYRDLIIDIHEYLAWILHSEAELYKNGGTIHIEDLIIKLNKYLVKEGHQTDIINKLFQVVKERVCALVSRVQGTFEFEVQPLREYFCAKYLYKTKPYSPVGTERTGTLPDRFETISRNFYWQNVVRFFAGCFDKGELSMLIQKLRELLDDNILKYTNYPRILTSQILSDYVFTQYPLLMKDVVKIIVDGVNIGSIINHGEETSSNNESIILPIACGRIEIVKECFDQLKTFPATDYASELIGLIKNNPYKIIENWSEYVSVLKGEKLSLWLDYAYRLQIIHQIDESILVDVIKSENLLHAEKRLQVLIDGNRLDVIEKFPEFKKIVFNGILSSKINLLRRDSNYNCLQFLMLITYYFCLSRVLSSNDSPNISFVNFIQRTYHFAFGESSKKNILELKVNDSIDVTINSFSRSIKSALDSELSSWRDSIEQWDAVVENGRSFFGDCWSLNIIAVISAGIKSRMEIYDEFNNISDPTLSLCKRARCARMKSGNVKYWCEQLQDGANLQFKLLVFFTWATSKTILLLLETLSPIIDSLTNVEFLQLAGGIKKTSFNSNFNKIRPEQILHINMSGIKNALKFLISLRFDPDNHGFFIWEKEGVDDKPRVIEEIIKLKFGYLIKKYLLNTSDESVLAEIKDVYREVKIDDERFYFSFNRRANSTRIPFEIAQTIMADCKKFPKVIAILAEKSCKIYAYKLLKPVGEVAENEKWF